jgi:hypothetical protein
MATRDPRQSLEFERQLVDATPKRLRALFGATEAPTTPEYDESFLKALSTPMPDSPHLSLNLVPSAFDDLPVPDPWKRRSDGSVP